MTAWLIAVRICMRTLCWSNKFQILHLFGLPSQFVCKITQDLHFLFKIEQRFSKWLRFAYNDFKNFHFSIYKLLHCWFSFHINPMIARLHVLIRLWVNMWGGAKARIDLVNKQWPNLEISYPALMSYWFIFVNLNSCV